MLSSESSYTFKHKSQTEHGLLRRIYYYMYTYMYTEKNIEKLWCKFEGEHSSVIRDSLERENGKREML